jgi:hypothetical protein
MKPRNKGRIGGPFVPSVKSTMKEPAWRAMSHGARSLYLALKSRYNSRLMNAVYLSTREAEKELGSFSRRESVGRWFRELQYYGFIVLVTPGHLGVEGRGKAPHYRLTEEFHLGERPTREFERWNGTKFHRQKSPNYYLRQERYRLREKQNPGPSGATTLDRLVGPPVDNIGSKNGSSGPSGGSIQLNIGVPSGGSITSLTTPCASLGPDNLDIPAFLDRRSELVA